jgi:plastocyanin
MKRLVLIASAALAVGVAGAMIASTALAGGGGGGGACHEEVSQGRGSEVHMLNNCFGPTILRVDEGATVEFVSYDSAPHAVLGVGGGWGSALTLRNGDSVRHEFGSAGFYLYYCPLHPGMIGAVVVGDPGEDPFGSVAYLGMRREGMSDRANEGFDALTSASPTSNSISAPWVALIAAAAAAGAGGAGLVATRRR